jgi:hypothetical protein
MTRKRMRESLRAVLPPIFMPTSLGVEDIWPDYIGNPCPVQSRINWGVSKMGTFLFSKRMHYF